MPNGQTLYDIANALDKVNEKGEFALPSNWVKTALFLLDKENEKIAQPALGAVVGMLEAPHRGDVLQRKKIKELHDKQAGARLTGMPETEYAPSFVPTFVTEKGSREKIMEGGYKEAQRIGDSGVHSAFPVVKGLAEIATFPDLVGQCRSCAGGNEGDASIE